MQAIGEIKRASIDDGKNLEDTLRLMSTCVQTAASAKPWSCLDKAQ